MAIISRTISSIVILQLLMGRVATAELDRKSLRGRRAPLRYSDEFKALFKSFDLPDNSAGDADTSSGSPSASPSIASSESPSQTQSTISPTKMPSSAPSLVASTAPTGSPSVSPTLAPSPTPSSTPIAEPSSGPTSEPSQVPSNVPSTPVCAAKGESCHSSLDCCDGRCSPQKICYSSERTKRKRIYARPYGGAAGTLSRNVPRNKRTKQNTRDTP